MYYKRESLKAKFCVKGAELLYKYCKDRNIPVKTGGKLIVAVDSSEIDTLDELYDRGEENGVTNLKMLCNLEEILKIEPNAKGMQALWSPNTGNVDFRIVTESFGKDFRNNGGDILFNNKVNVFSHFLILLYYSPVNSLEVSRLRLYLYRMSCRAKLGTF